MSPHKKLSNKSGWVYLGKCFDLNGKADGWYKYGMSSISPYDRISQIKAKERVDIRLEWFFQSLNARSAESLIASIVSALSHEIRGEFFRPKVDEAFILELFEGFEELEKKAIRKALGR